MLFTQRRASVAPVSKKLNVKPSPLQRVKQAIRSFFHRKSHEQQLPLPVKQQQQEEEVMRRVSVDVPNLEALFTDEDELLLSQAPLPLVQVGRVRNLARRFESLNASAHRLHPVSRMAKSLNDVKLQQSEAELDAEVEAVIESMIEATVAESQVDAVAAHVFPSQFIMERSLLLMA